MNSKCKRWHFLFTRLSAPQNWQLKIELISKKTWHRSCILIIYSSSDISFRRYVVTICIYCSENATDAKQASQYGWKLWVIRNIFGKKSVSRIVDSSSSSIMATGMALSQSYLLSSLWPNLAMNLFLNGWEIWRKKIKNNHHFRYVWRISCRTLNTKNQIAKVEFY